jgi:Cu+-exporting ATPase
MMKRTIFAFVMLCASWFITSCTQPQAPEVKGPSITHRDLESEVNKTVANLSIEGMTCAQGCGGKIQQDLQAISGVKQTDLDFLEGRAQNVVMVEFDPSVTNEQALIQCVQGIADGKYRVLSVEVMHFKGLQQSKVEQDLTV